MEIGQLVPEVGVDHDHHRVDDGVDDHADNGDPVWDDEGVTVEIGQVVRLEAINHQCLEPTFSETRGRGSHQVATIVRLEEIISVRTRRQPSVLGDISF